MKCIENKQSKESKIDIEIPNEVAFFNPKPGYLNLYKTSMTEVFFFSVLVLMMYSYYEVGGWYGLLDIFSMEGLRYVGSAFVVYLLVSCFMHTISIARRCQCGSKRFKVTHVGTEYIDTTPQTASGRPNLRYTPTEVEEMHYKFVCRSCGGYHYDVKVV